MKCIICNGNANLKKEVKERQFRKEDFIIVEHFYKCESCGEEFTTTGIDELNVTQVYNQYRAKHHIPFPEEIVSIRKKYNLSASKMSEILGFGINTYRNYEDGEIPSAANSKFLILANDPSNFKRLLENNGIELKKSEKTELLNRISELLNDETKSDYFEIIINQHNEANEFTGYKKPNTEKIKNILLYLLNNMKKEFADKVKINKMFYYADFLNYCKTGYSITGITYRAITYGPVPSNYDILYGMCEEEGIIENKFVRLSDGSAKQLFVPIHEFDNSIFSEAELKTLTKVVDKFKDISSWDLVDISHKEKSWIDLNANKELISYQKYGFDLVAFKK